MSLLDALGGLLPGRSPEPQPGALTPGMTQPARQPGAARQYWDAIGDEYFLPTVTTGLGLLLGSGRQAAPMLQEYASGYGALQAEQERQRKLQEAAGKIGGLAPQMQGVIDAAFALGDPETALGVAAQAALRQPVDEERRQLELDLMRAQIGKARRGPAPAAPPAAIQTARLFASTFGEPGSPEYTQALQQALGGGAEPMDYEVVRDGSGQLFRVPKSGAFDVNQAQSFGAGKPGGGTRVQVGPDGEVLFEQGSNLGELTSSRQTATQADIQLMEDDISDLRSISRTIEDDFLTLRGRTNSNIGSWLDYTNSDYLDGVADAVGGEGYSDNVKEFSAEASAAIAQVERFFNRYRKQITGAAASIQELQALRQATLSGELGPAAFHARLNSMLDQAQADVARRRATLRDGVSLGEPAAPAPQGALAPPTLQPSTPPASRGALAPPESINSPAFGAVSEQRQAQIDSAVREMPPEQYQALQRRVAELMKDEGLPAGLAAERALQELSQ